MNALDDTIRVHPALYVAIEAMMTGEPPVATIAVSKYPGGMFWMAHRFIPDETLGRDEIRRGEDVPEWHVQRLRDAMAEYAARKKDDWFVPCTDKTHPRAPHLHVPSGPVAVTDERISNAAKTLAFPETDARQEKAARYVEVKCRKCGWLHLIAPRERDHPCEAVASCAGTVSDPEDRTFECVPLGFTKRVAALLKSIEDNGRDEFDSSACPCCGDNPYGPSPPIHNPDDCELAALLKECEG